MDNFVGRNK